MIKGEIEVLNIVQFFFDIDFFEHFYSRLNATSLTGFGSEAINPFLGFLALFFFINSSFFVNFFFERNFFANSASISGNFFESVAVKKQSVRNNAIHEITIMRN